ncbi:MAG: hypothetical protein KIT84_27565 [Labilithrix sp.]|nr:hypothetical protein [Labilithrix sp.]MCW5814817.1 hypothetical protein [Labilithrix sp.]
MSVLQALIDRDLTELLDDVCRRHHVTRDDVCGRGRTRAVSAARQELWWRLRNHPTTAFSYLEIGRLFDRNHTTVLFGVRAWEARASPNAA